MTAHAHKSLRAVVFLLFAVTIHAGATTMSSEKVSCPVCQNDVYLARLASFGSYIFEEPCKYDLIYAPASYKSFIVTCRKCGYSQTVADFLSLSPSQVQKLKSTKLMANWQPVSETVSFPDRLERAIQVNQELDRTKEFWAFFNRILIYHLRELDPKRAAEVAKHELGLVKYDQHLRSKQRLYLLGEYSRLAGDAAGAENFLRKAAGTSINRQLITSLVALNCACVLIGILLVWCFNRRSVSGVAIGIVAGVLVLSVWLYLRGRLPDANDAYFDRIIADRMELLTETGNTGKETEPIQSE